jgi:hypothetical protein
MDNYPFFLLSLFYCEVALIELGVLASHTLLIHPYTCGESDIISYLHCPWGLTRITAGNELCDS